MEINMKEIGKIIKDRDKVDSHGYQKMYMKGNGRMIKCMVKVNIILLMVIVMLVHLLKIKWKEKESFIFKMEINIKGHLRMV
jgi:hypothetical protein